MEGGLRTKGVLKGPRPGLPLVSVITVVLNGAGHIEDAIRSVLGQTYENVEYIVVDGGSTDGTLDAIRKYEDRIDLWVSGPDRGISDAFNKGISLARGEIVGTINSDDWYEPDAVQKAVAAFASSGADIVAGALRYWRGDNRDYVYLSNPDALEKEVTLNHQTVFIKKALYLRYGLFSTAYRYAMDYDLLLRFKLKGAGFLCLDDVLANMRLEGISHRGWLSAYREVREIKTALMGHGWANYLYYLYMVGRRLTSATLSRIGLAPLVGYYRARHSIVKKLRP